jgi:hypothetical protein
MMYSFTHYTTYHHRDLYMIRWPYQCLWSVSDFQGRSGASTYRSRVDTVRGHAREGRQAKPFTKSKAQCLARRRLCNLPCTGRYGPPHMYRNVASFSLSTSTATRIYCWFNAITEESHTTLKLFRRCTSVNRCVWCGSMNPVVTLLPS